MEIDWFGLSCVRLREGGVTVITDPYDKSAGYTQPRMRADIVTMSNDGGDRSGANAVKGEFKVFSKPGEYEVKGVFVTGIQTLRNAGGGDEGKEENTVFAFEFGTLTVCHLGDLAKVLTQAQVESLPNIDVLLVPVGGAGTLDADRAAEVISLLEPGIVIPIRYQTQYGGAELEPLGHFLKEMGVTEHAPQESFKVTRAELPEETQVIVLECKQG